MNIICITNRSFSSEPFLTRLERLAKAGPHAIILRESDLSEKQYEELAKECLQICQAQNVEFVIHSHYRLLTSLGTECIHLPLWKLKENPDIKKHATQINIPVNCVEEAREAQALGANSLLVGHIFKKSLQSGQEGRGLEFLKSIVKVSSVPVYALGGINLARAHDVAKAGAVGACIMTEAMQSDKIEEIIATFKTVTANSKKNILQFSQPVKTSE